MSIFFTIHGHNVADIFMPHLQEFSDFEVRDSDVFIVTSPKAGTTWTLEMVWLLLNNLDYKEAEAPLDMRCPFLESFVVMRSLKHSAESPSEKTDFYFHEVLGNSLERANHLPSPRVIKTHLPWPFLPRQIREKTTKAKVIYVSRNPKDMCISLHHHWNLFKSNADNIDAHCEQFLTGKYWFGPFWKHVLPFWDMRNELNVLFIKYEDMKKNLPLVIRTVSDFLGKRYEDGEIEKLAEHLSFGKMRNNVAVNKQLLLKSIGGSEESNFLRRGIVDSHKTEMPEEYIRKFDECIKKHFDGTGLIYN